VICLFFLFFLQCKFLDALRLLLADRDAAAFISDANNLVPCLL
jgi:hypothetical protein